MLCVLAVFLPSFLMQGAARALFVPLSLAVGFSMIASYLLASSLVPVVFVWLMRSHRAEKTDTATTPRLGFESFRAGYGRFVQRTVPWRWLIVTGYLAAAAIVVLVVGSRLGTEIFPKVEAGQLQLRLRAQPGTRVDRTEALALRVLEIVKQETGPDGIALTLAFVGVHAPSYPINFVYQWNGGPEEGVLQVQLKATGALDDLKERLRKRFAREMPDVLFSFEPSDIVSRVMSFGSATPIEVAVSGPSLAADAEFAERVRQQLERIPVLRDVHLGQSLDYPTLNVAVDRERAGLLGIRTVDVARSLVAATSSSRFTQPVYWADPGSGVAYQVQVQIPQQQMGSPEDVGNIPVGLRGGQSVLLRNVATVTPGTAVGQYERYNMQRLVTVTANIQGTDLGHAAAQVAAALRALGDPPPRVSVAVRGQVVPMQQMMDGLRNGLLLAVVAIFLLLAANFESLRLSLVVTSTLPAVDRRRGPRLVGHGHDAQHPILHGRDHGDRRGGRQRDPARDVRGAEPDRGRAGRAGRRCGSAEPAAAGPDDQPGDDGRDGPHGARPGRRRGANGPPRTRGDRGPRGGHGRHSARPPFSVRDSPESLDPALAIPGSGRSPERALRSPLGLKGRQ